MALGFATPTLGDGSVTDPIGQGRDPRPTFSGITTPHDVQDPVGGVKNTIAAYGSSTEGASNEIAFGGSTAYAGQQAQESRRLAGFHGSQATPGMQRIDGQDAAVRAGLADATVAAGGNWNSGGQRALNSSMQMVNNAAKANANSARGSSAARAANRMMAASSIDNNNQQAGIMRDQLYAQEQLAGMSRAGQSANAMRGIEDAKVGMTDAANTRQLGQNAQMSQYFLGRENQMYGRQLATQVARQGYVDQNSNLEYNGSNAVNHINRGVDQAMITDAIGGFAGATGGIGQLTQGGGNSPGLGGAAPPAPPAGGGYQPGQAAVNFGISDSPYDGFGYTGNGR